MQCLPGCDLGLSEVSLKKILYQELVLEPLQLRRWFRKLHSVSKAHKSNQPSYLSNIVPQRNFALNTRNVERLLF